MPSQSSPSMQLSTVLGFMKLLWATVHGLQKTSKRMERELTVSGPQRLALLFIERQPNISPGQLARLMQLHPSTITGVLQRLEDRRLIRRITDDRDGRRMHLLLTARGRRMNRPHHRGTVEQAVRHTLDKFGERRLKSAGEVLNTLAEGLISGGAKARR